MSTQELLNTMVASQIKLREDMNLMVQQFQNLKSSQEGDKRARRMDDLMDY